MNHVGKISFQRISFQRESLHFIQSSKRKEPSIQEDSPFFLVFQQLVKLKLSVSSLCLQLIEGALVSLFSRNGYLLLESIKFSWLSYFQFCHFSAVVIKNHSSVNMSLFIVQIYPAFCCGNIKRSLRWIFRLPKEGEMVWERIKGGDFALLAWSSSGIFVNLFLQNLSCLLFHNLTAVYFSGYFPSCLPKKHDL